MTKKNILIIEPDEITRVLLAEEVEQTKNNPVLVSDIDEGFRAIKSNNISLVICDNDFREGDIFAEELKKDRCEVPVITTSTFLHNQKLVSKNGFFCCLKKPVDGDGYKKLRHHLNGLKEIR